MRKRYPRREYAQQVARRYRDWDTTELDRHAALLSGRLLVISAILERRGDLYATFFTPAMKRVLERVYENHIPEEAYE